MSILLPALLVLVLTVLAVTAALAVRATESPTGRLAEVSRTTRRWRAAGLLGGLLAAWITYRWGSLGRGVMLAGPVLALGLLVGVVAGELRVRAPGGVTRAAPLEVRRAGDYLPRGLGAAVAAAGLLLAALLSGTTALGSTDDLGRAGRTLARQCSALVSESRSPWPGVYYSLPLAAVVVTGLLVAAVALRAVVRRPRQGEEPRIDDALRRHAATAVVAAVGLLVTVPLVGVGFFTVSALEQICAPPTTWTVAGRALLVVVPAAAALGIWCVAVLLVPASDRSRVPVDR